MSRTAVRYATEISQMVTVLGADPDEDSVRYIEDIVRCQISDMVIAARDLSARRGSRTLQTEDILFLHRHETGRSARLRAFLSWRDTTRRYYGSDADEAEGYDEIIGDALATQRQPLRARWDVISTLSEGLLVEEEESIEDQRMAFESNEHRLRSDDALTRRLSLDDYRQYSETREATFTWKKGKRFRDFINLGANVDPNALDEITDVLGFLAFEIVRSICERGLTFEAPERPLSDAKATEQPEMPPPPVPLKRTRTQTGPSDEAASPSKSEAEVSSPSAPRRPRLRTSTSTLSTADSPPDSTFATPRSLSYNGLSTQASVPSGPFSTRQPTPPPAEPIQGATPIIMAPKTLALTRIPLTVEQVHEAYLEKQTQQFKPRNGGLRNFRRGWPMRRMNYA